jgi:hypothetical protein
MRAIGVLIVIISGLLLGAGAPAYAAPPAATIGPMEINPVGHPHLCWESTGNGAPIALAKCDSSLQNQQWSLTPNGVLMNGIGYCLESRPGHSHGTPLYIDFASQCGGSRGQVWTYNGSTSQLSSTGACAGLAGSVAANIQVVRASCGKGPRWSLGYSSVSLTPGPASGPAGGTYSAIVKVANAASAQSAYGVTTTITLPADLAVTALHGTGAAASFRCSEPTLTCTGTLPAGASGDISLTGHLPAGATPGASYPASARVAVHGTSQLASATRTTALLKVNVSAAAAPAPAAGGVILPLSMPLLGLIVGVLLLCGGLLVGLALRRRPARRRATAHSYAAGHSRPPVPAQTHFDPQASDDPYRDAPSHANGRPHAYEGRRRRTAPEPLVSASAPLASAPRPRQDPDPLPGPGRHHAHR